MVAANVTRNSGVHRLYHVYVYIIVVLLAASKTALASGMGSLEKTISSAIPTNIDFDFVEMGRMRAKFTSIESSEFSSMKMDEIYKPKKSAKPLVNEHGRIIPDQTALSGMSMSETGAADPDAEHTVVFQVRQLNKHLLLPKLLEVSSPRMERKHYTREEVGELTSNPKASKAVEDFLKSHGDKIISYDMGPYGEYIKATAKVSVWSELLNANFRQFEITYDYFENVVMEAPKKLVRALSYSLPTFLVDHVECVRNTVQILPRRTLQPKADMSDPLEVVTKSSLRKQHKKKLSDTDCPVGTFMSSRTGECKSDVITPQSLYTVYGIPDPSGGEEKASQGILSMIDDNVSPDDLKVFSERFGIKNNPMKHLIGGHDDSRMCLDDFNKTMCAEPNLDVQYMRAMSWDSDMWRYFEEDPLSWLVAMSVEEEPPLVNSVSYGYLEPELLLMDPTYVSSFDHEAMKLGLRGVTLVVASGDDGVGSFMVRGGTLFCGYTPSFPATSPYVTAVGGTQGVEQAGSGLMYDRHFEEEAANCVPNATYYVDGQPGGPNNGKGAGIVSGGGFSSTTLAPEFQTEFIHNYFYNLGFLNMPWLGYSFTGRGYPDISLSASSYIVAIGGEFFPVSGTSASSPAFAGMVSLVNAGRFKAGKGPIGYLNPAIYAHHDKFTRDVTKGDNYCAAGDCTLCCGQGFVAKEGWDPVTGFGTVDFPSFYKTMMTVEMDHTTPPPDYSLAGAIVGNLVAICLLSACVYVVYTNYLNPDNSNYEQIPEDGSAPTGVPTTSNEGPNPNLYPQPSDTGESRS